MNEFPFEEGKRQRILIIRIPENGRQSGKSDLNSRKHVSWNCQVQWLNQRRLVYDTAHQRLSVCPESYETAFTDGLLVVWSFEMVVKIWCWLLPSPAAITNRPADPRRPPTRFCWHGRHWEWLWNRTGPCLLIGQIMSRDDAHKNFLFAMQTHQTNFVPEMKTFLFSTEEEHEPRNYP